MMLEAASRGASGQNRVREGDFLRLEIPLPPLPEQRRVTAILDEADAVRTRSGQSLDWLDRLEASHFAREFSGRPTDRLDAVVDPDDRINYGVVQPGDDMREGVPLIRAGDIGPAGIATTKLKRISPGIEARYARSRVRGTEVLVACVGSIGSVGVVGPAHVGANVARAVARVPVSDPAQRAFVAAALKTDAVQRYFTTELRTVAQPTLNIKQLAATPIPVVSRREIVSFNRFAEELADERGALSIRQAQFDSLFASLQHRAFRGEL